MKALAPPVPENAETWTDELHDCPDCGAPVDHDGQPEWHDGAIFVDVRCPECAFRGREMWTHENTVRTYGDDQHALSVLLSEVETVLEDPDAAESMIELRSAFEQLAHRGGP